MARSTDDCRKTFDELSGKGVEFTQEPTEQPYGVECALRDPFGNQIRVTQRPKGPVEITEADRARGRRDQQLSASVAM